MARPAKTERNRDIVRKRVADPRRWSIRVLGRHFRMDPRAVWEIVDRDLQKYATPAQIRRYRGLLRICTGCQHPASGGLV